MTLVELMVTMVIASIVAASTFMFFAGQQRVYETQTKMLNVQQNAWAAMEVLTRFVRAAGSGMYGCVRPVGGIVPSPPVNRTPASTNPDDSDDPPVALTTSPVSLIHDLYPPPNAGLRAYVGSSMQRIPPLWIVDQADPSQSHAHGIMSQTDVITVAFGNRTSGTTFDSPLAITLTQANVDIVLPAGNAAMFDPNEFIVLVGEPGMGGAASDIGCTLLQITNVPPPIGSAPANTLVHATTSSWNPSGNPAGMIPGTGYGAFLPDQNMNTGVRNFGEFWWVRFAVMIIDPNNPNDTTNPIHGLTNPGIPVLTMQRLDSTSTSTSTSGPQILAEGIEDLQVAFACDLNADGVLTATSDPNTDEWKLDPNDVIALNRGAKCNQPSAVRLTLVARSLTPDNGIDAKDTFNGRPAVENHLDTCCCQLNPPTCPQTNTTCCDQYRRRVLTTTVYPRNN
jgi:type II secretory pathway pseudopilin PulG